MNISILTNSLYGLAGCLRRKLRIGHLADHVENRHVREGHMSSLFGEARIQQVRRRIEGQEKDNLADHRLVGRNLEIVEGSPGRENRIGEDTGCMDQTF